MTLFFISVRVILHPGATLATGSSFHNRKVGRTNPVGHAGSKSEPTNATIWCPWIFCRAIQTFLIAAKPDRSLVWLVGCSSCKVPFFQSCGTGTHRGGTHLQLFSTSTKDRIPLTSGEHVLCKMFVRGGQIGPESLCILILSFPTGAMTLVRSRGAAAGSVPTSPAGSPACLVT